MPLLGGPACQLRMPPWPALVILVSPPILRGDCPGAATALAAAMPAASAVTIEAMRMCGLLVPAPSSSRLNRCRSEEHTSELQSLMRISYAVLCLTEKIHHQRNTET